MASGIAVALIGTPLLLMVAASSGFLADHSGTITPAVRLDGHVHGYHIALIASAVAFALALATVALLIKKRTRTDVPPTPSSTSADPNHLGGREPFMSTDSDSAAFWENHYSRLDEQWGTKPNAVLEELVTTLAPEAGTALDLGCGHGGDAIWLAVRGWDVTAVDVAPTALQRVATGAHANGVAERVHPARHDLAHDFPAGRFDLVNASYFHTPLDIPRAKVLRRAAAAVADGGLLIIVEHASVAPWSWQAGEDVHFPRPEEVLASLELDDARWTAERCHAPQRTATGPQGQTAMVTDNVLALRRTPEGASDTGDPSVTWP
ncbi:methyltransferase domain-containing protein [Micromonospora sp. WMMA1363]|uniref:class I SAM-dependent methyltransferase n=1 Tax=Micromonospora sp. WMMA1363 TaxID=3053985 RepID=UPI00259C6FEF|nr:methyltransferase domain-containing protein [Micromonospora sp. WMMA1363]MDM4721501.1 methyltransferase domain-containing protein [Micromonospora sp. WMMA1363]